MNNQTNQFSTPQRTRMVAILVLVILIAIWSVVHHWRPPTPGPNPALTAGLGQALATETARMLHERGQIGVIILPVHEMEGLPEHNTWQAFITALKQHPQIHLVGTEIANTEPPSEYGLTRARLDKVLAAHPEIDGLVSFYGVAQWDPRSPFESPRKGLKIIALQSNPVPIKPYLANGSLAVAIVRREIIGPNAAPPRTPADWVGRNYQVVTSENYQSLPDEEAPQ